MLPRLVGEQPVDTLLIRCADFSDAVASPPQKVHFVVGNPPWTQVKAVDAPAVLWTKKQRKPFPGRQLATAFASGRHRNIWWRRERFASCLPHGILFNHTAKAIDFQRQWITHHAIEWVLNLADYQYFLFEDAKAPALVVRYAQSPIPYRHRSSH